jgi:hypothetical protein
VRALAVLLLLLPLTACGQVVDPHPDNGSAGQAAPPSARDAGPLCDGSSEMRLTYESGGGAVDETYPFTNPHGHVFLAIDGTCRFYASMNYMRGIASATLSQADADALAKDTHWSELAGWHWTNDYGCPDAGGVGLTRAKATASCTCGCDAGAPKGLDDALSKAYEWVQRLTTSGQPLDGTVSAIALEGSAGGSLNVPVVTWPLPRAMGSIPGLLHKHGEPEFWMGTAKYAHFDAAADYTKLRQARVATTNHDVPGSGMVSTYIPIEEGSTRYDLYVRDELPDAIEAAWDRLKATLAAP